VALGSQTLTGVGSAEGLFLLSFIGLTVADLTLGFEWDSVLILQGYGSGLNGAMDRRYKKDPSSWLYLKPANTKLSPDGIVKIPDLGVVSQFERHGFQETPAYLNAMLF
jgi:hypothetical protein